MHGEASVAEAEAEPMSRLLSLVPAYTSSSCEELPPRRPSVNSFPIFQTFASFTSFFGILIHPQPPPPSVHIVPSTPCSLTFPLHLIHRRRTLVDMSNPKLTVAIDVGSS